MVSTRRSNKKVNQEVVNVKQSKDATLSASSPKFCRRKPHTPRKFQIDGTEGRSTRMTENSLTENLTLYKIEHQTDEATFAAKYSGANGQAEHQLEDDQLSGSLAQATIRNLKIQALKMPLYTTQVTEKDASQEENTTPNVIASENALCVIPGSNGLGEICFTEKLDPSSNNTTTASMSLNMTEFAEQNVTDEFSDIDSGESSLMFIRGYRVKPEYVALLTSILSKHGDIGAKCSLSSISVRSLFMEKLCDILQKLSGTSIGVITEHEVEDMRASVSDIGNASVEVGWLKKRLDEIYEAKKAMGQLRSTSNLKMLHAQRRKRLAEMKVQLEGQKSYFADMEAQVRDLKNQIYAVQSDISTMENQVLETEKVISETRKKLKKVWEMGSLVNGLIET